MVRSFKDTINGMSIDLYYSVRSKKDLAYIDEFEQAAQTFKGFRIIPFVFDAQGYLTMKTISETSGPLEGKDFFLCGPPVMIEGLKNQLLSYKIPKEDIHSEEFSML